MNNLDKYINPGTRSIVYTLDEEEITKAFERLVKDHTGVDVDLEISIFGDYNTDVVIELKTDSDDDYTKDYSDADFEAMSSLIIPQEGFLTRDALIQLLTGVDRSHLEWHEEEDEEPVYELWIIEDALKPQDKV